MYDLDTTAADMLQDLQRELAQRGVTLGLAEPHAPMREMLHRSGLLADLGGENVFSTVGGAIRSYLTRTEEPGLKLGWRPVE